MPSYHVHPKAPLLFRDGRPFNASDAAQTLPFPLPSTLAGAIRTAYGDANGLDFKQAEDQLRQIAIAGPMLTETDQSSGEQRLMFPAPADALCLSSAQGNMHHRLAPQAMSKGEGCDMPLNGLEAVFPLEPCKEKPATDAPRFWYLEHMAQWLADDIIDCQPAAGTGIGALPVELRTHVAIAKHSLTNESGKLYQTNGLDFAEQRLANGEVGWQTKRYGLAVHSTAELTDDYRTVGGESRLAHIQRDDQLWPQCPSALQIALSKSKGLRLQLVTPAIFEHGWRPSWVNEDLSACIPHLGSLELTLKAVAVPRWQAVSGWDMQRGSRGQRPVRRMAPAGSVYWFEINSGDAGAAIDLWLQSVSDSQASDGFGLVVPGVWNR